MKIAVITDAHANYPALKAALNDAARTGYDLMFHTGDAIAIGPQPRECLDLLLSIPNLRCVQGNHEDYFSHGLPDWIAKGEVEHQRWTHAQLTPEHKRIVTAWPRARNEVFEGVKVIFVHYALDKTGERYVDFTKTPDAAFLDRVFAGYDAPVIFYGHEHTPSDIESARRYINPGSLGCSPTAVARYCLAEFKDGKYTIEHRAVPYDDRELYECFQQRPVPEKHFINRAFFGGRFTLE